ncbi:universal stress protein [Streptomyces laurentii]|uniref:universal stress protein n=1 Tax=Streptomyces laurentii TaxID=39478 RepID=UPI0036AD2796
MTRSIVVGLDGTEQADAAARWAADEAERRGTGVRLVHACEPSPEAVTPCVARGPVEEWARDLLARTAAVLRERHHGLPVTTRLLPADPVPGLVAESEDATLLVLGSRALGRASGYVVGSVGTAVAGLAERPVVLVRPDGGPPPGNTVVAGVDPHRPDHDVLEFAFDAAARRGARLEIVYAQRLPPFATPGPAMAPDLRYSVSPAIRRALDDLIDPWRAKYDAEVTATGRVVAGSAGPALIRAAAHAALVVIGRRTRRSPWGGRIGSTAHAVLHHARPPVVLVPSE